VKKQLLKKQFLLSAAVGVLAGLTPALAAPPPPPPAIYNWTGFYVGANAGYSWGQGAVIYNDSGWGPKSPLTGANNLDGAIGGTQIGYNWQLNNSWVAGVETDFQLANEKASKTFVPFSDTEGAVVAQLMSKIEWFGTVRGRLGWLFNPMTMVYATGGLAYGRVNASGTFIDSTCTPSPACEWGFNKSAINVGWTVGGGIEGAFPNAPNWTWKIEYLYIDLGSVSGSGFDPDFVSIYTYNARFTDNIFRVGGSWHFY